MRLLIATDAFPPKCGGSGWSAFYLARAMTARGHQVEIVQPKRGLQGRRTRAFEGQQVTELGYAASNVPGLRAWQSAAALNRDLTGFLAERARNADLIHAQHLLTIPPAVRAGRLANVPVISTVRDYWPVCLYGTLWRDGGSCPACRGAELTRCFGYKYGPFATLAYPLWPLVQRELARRQRALQASSAVVAVSHFVAGKLNGLIEADKVSVIPNLIDIAETRRLANCGEAPGGPPPAVNDTADHTPYPSRYLVFIGKLNALKGADLLPEILRRASVDLPVIVAGDGELKPLLERERNVQVQGWLSNRDALALLARAEALLFPSKWAEPLARVLIEAQALGVPTVALDTGGTRDIIAHEVNGLLADQVADFSAQLARLVSDRALQARLRSGAAQVAQAKFSDGVVAGQLEAVYERVLFINR